MSRCHTPIGGVSFAAPDPIITAVDLFCGAGGLTRGLRRAGIRVSAGVDVDPEVAYAYTRNNPGVRFLDWDVSQSHHSHFAKLFEPTGCRLLAGCAPCQPFSRLTHGRQRHESWDLIDHFGRLVRLIGPELVTMENVPELADRGWKVFARFLSVLDGCGYQCDWKVVQCVQYGVPQARVRLVLLASRLGPISVPAGRYRYPSQWRTVRDTIGDLPPLAAGEVDPGDDLHGASRLTELNLRRLRSTPPDGGTSSSWPRELRLACHLRESGRSYSSIYGRMWWDRPAPTMTTLCNGIGNGRFGHPSQDRAITLREAALLQTFPRSYRFWPPGEKLNRRAVGRMIGNAVPPKLGKALGEAIVDHVRRMTKR